MTSSATRYTHFHNIIRYLIIFKNKITLSGCTEDKIYLPNISGGKERFKIIYKWCKNLKSKKILDVGGVEETSKFFLNLFPNAKVYTLNIRKDLKAKLKVIGNAQLLPFKNGVFDLVFCGEIIEHLVNPINFLKEVKRVLKKNGKLIITTPNMAAWHNRILLLFGYPPSNYTAVPHTRYGLPRFIRDKPSILQDHTRVFTFNQLEELLIKSGFKIIDTKGINQMEFNRPFRKIRIVLNYLLPKKWKEDIIIYCEKR